MVGSGTFATNMKVLEMGAFDAIMGYDCLKTHSPMTCHWENRTLKFVANGKKIFLQGIRPPPLELQEIRVEQLAKWCAGNEVGAFAIVETLDTTAEQSPPPEVQIVLYQYQDIFEDPKTLPPERPLDHTIPLLPNAIPVNSKPYRYSPLHKDEIEKQVNELSAAGLITPGTSSFTSLVLLVHKKDGSWRFCMDYHKLNDITVKNRFPMPIINQILDELVGATYFSKLDMRSGYHQVRMKKEEEHKAAFKTHHIYYQFKVMPFGLTNAPATFQCIMNTVLEPFLRKFVLAFLDDILIYSPDLESHVQHLRMVLDKLREHKLYMKLSKYSFAQSQLAYLGHIITEKGVAADPSKIESMVNWPILNSITELRGFLGLTGYYRKFIHHYEILAKPLTNLLRKKQFEWSHVAQQAFVQLKHTMISTPVLAIPDFALPFIVETNACDLGIGAVLMQNDQLVAYLSKALGPLHQKLSIYEKEFLVLIMAVETWRPYLQRQEFIIRTDRKSLSHLTE